MNIEGICFVVGIGSILAGLLLLAAIAAAKKKIGNNLKKGF
ncbi:hypothetical protein EDD76_102297 [Kineothrix alysoides]|uniref:Uncharacterized protein n=1 Tax=Kineothrix alysoides TaxID=1469948 RepID=A0A4R1R543_9FIRM|nr:hypothetical protein [Kineothrix alysoides]TCL60599.1 hypothetical protein EDD76_102297 [Kineothrix alysoides]